MVRTGVTLLTVTSRVTVTESPPLSVSVAESW